MAYVPYAVTFADRYEIVGPNGVKAVFNDPLDPNYVGMITELTGLDSPDVRESSQDIVEGDGGVHGSFYFGRRPLTMTCRVFGHATLAERAVRIDRARRATLALRSDATLSWKPAERRENFIPNPNFETDISGWTTSSSAGFISPTLTQGTTWGAPGSGGTKALRQTATQPADSTLRALQASITGIGTTAIPVVAGRSYYISAVVNHVDAPAVGSAVRLDWYKADGTASATPNSIGTSVGAATNGVFTPTLTVNAPADAAYARPMVRSLTSTSGDVLDVHFDTILFTETAMGTTYLDGSVAGFHWQGTPGASASGDFVEMFIPVRRQQPFRETGQWVKEVQISLVSEFAVLMSEGLLATASTASGTGVTAENKGSYVVYPIIEITAVSASPTVTDGHGNTFRTSPSGSTLTLASGEKVEFDMLNHTGAFTAGARNGQSANRYIDFALTTWPNLRGGTTETFTLSGGGSMVVKWRHAWV